MNNVRKQKPLVPRRIRIGRKQYSVDVIETMLNKGDMARVFYDKRKIQLGQHSNKTGRKFTDDEMQESFWHELVHAILYDMDEHKLNRNEKFVTEFSKRLTEAVTSARFE